MIFSFVVWLFFRLVFRLLCQETLIGFSVLVFLVVCKFFGFLSSGFQFS